MTPEVAVPSVPVAAGFGILLIVLAYAVQRERLIDPSIVSVICCPCNINDYSVLCSARIRSTVRIEILSPRRADA